MIHASPKGCFVIKLQITGNAKGLPVVNKEAYNAVRCFALILFQVGLGCIDVWKIFFGRFFLCIFALFSNKSVSF